MNSEIPVGARVEIKGLTAKNLNGLKGIVVTPVNTKGRLGIMLDNGRTVSVKESNLLEMKTNWSNIKNTLGITRRGKFKGIYAFGSSRKNAYKNKTIKELKAILTNRGISTRGMTNRRNLENALNTNRGSNTNISEAKRRLEYNNANTRRATERETEQRNLFETPLSNLINEAHRGVARLEPAKKPSAGNLRKFAALLRKPNSTIPG
jgi:hypothetical protein